MDCFPQNHWFVIALTSEITDHPLARTVCDEDIVCYRIPDGTAIALRDRCPHRRYPLSLGHLDDATLVCGYHGFSFDCSGTCVAVPGQTRIPPNTDVRPYHLKEQGMWTWVWIGDEEPEGDVPEATPWIEDDRMWSAVTGMSPIACRHSLLVDNLLDLSHEAYLHGGYIGTPEVAVTPMHTTIDRERGVVSVSRHMESVECPPFYARTTGLASPIDRWQDLEFFAPGFYVLHVRIAPAGSSDGDADSGAAHVKILYGLTPSTSGQTYDFWAVCRDFALDDDEVTKCLDTMQQEVVTQDVDALTILERRISIDPDPFEVIASIDRGALAARRIIRTMSGAESDRLIPEDESIEADERR